MNVFAEQLFTGRRLDCAHLALAALLAELDRLTRLFGANPLMGRTCMQAAERLGAAGDYAALGTLADAIAAWVADLMPPTTGIRRATALRAMPSGPCLLQAVSEEWDGTSPHGLGGARRDGPQGWRRLLGKAAQAKPNSGRAYGVPRPLQRAGPRSATFLRREDYDSEDPAADDRHVGALAGSRSGTLRQDGSDRRARKDLQ